MESQPNRAWYAFPDRSQSLACRLKRVERSVQVTRRGQANISRTSAFATVNASQLDSDGMIVSVSKLTTVG
jgi:hypothetical protein